MAHEFLPYTKFKWKILCEKSATAYIKRCEVNDINHWTKLNLSEQRLSILHMYIAQKNNILRDPEI